MLKNTQLWEDLYQDSIGTETLLCLQIILLIYHFMEATRDIRLLSETNSLLLRAIAVAHYYCTIIINIINYTRSLFPNTNRVT